MFKKLSLWLIVSVFISTTSWANSPTRVGVVDANKCIEQSESGKKLIASFEKKAEQVKKNLQAKEEELKKFKAELDQKRNVLNPDAVRQREKELERKGEDFRDLVREKETEFQKEKNAALQGLANKLAEVAIQIGKKEGYDLILEAHSGVVYVNKSIDLTDKVIRTFNEKKEK